MFTSTTVPRAERVQQGGRKIGAVGGSVWREGRKRPRKKEIHAHPNDGRAGKVREIIHGRTAHAVLKYVAADVDCESSCSLQDNLLCQSSSSDHLRQMPA